MEDGAVDKADDLALESSHGFNKRFEQGEGIVILGNKDIMEREGEELLFIGEEEEIRRRILGRELFFEEASAIVENVAANGDWALNNGSVGKEGRGLFIEGEIKKIEELILGEIDDDGHLTDSMVHHSVSVAPDPDIDNARLDSIKDLKEFGIFAASSLARGRVSRL